MREPAGIEGKGSERPRRMNSLSPKSHCRQQRNVVRALLNNRRRKIKEILESISSFVLAATSAAVSATIDDPENNQKEESKSHVPCAKCGSDL